MKNECFRAKHWFVRGHLKLGQWQKIICPQYLRNWVNVHSYFVIMYGFNNCARQCVGYYMNPFMVLLSIVQLAAMWYEFVKGNKYVALLYLCYSIANILLIIIAMKVKE